MTNKQTIDGVSRELLEEMLAAMKETHSLPEKYYGSTLGDRVRAILENLNAQSSHTAIGALHRDCDERIIFESLGEIHIKDGMQVYAEPATQPQGEVERLRIDLELTQLARQSDQIEIDGLKAINDGLRDQRDGLNALLREVANKCNVGFNMRQRLLAALSTSAEPKT